MLKKSSRVNVKNAYFNNFFNITINFSTAVNSPHNCYQESKFLFAILCLFTQCYKSFIRLIAWVNNPLNEDPFCFSLYYSPVPNNRGVLIKRAGGSDR